jgi:hypothetical protein
MKQPGQLAGRRSPAVPPPDVRCLEEVVRTVAMLHGVRAAALLSGLCEGLRPSALEILRRLERSSRPDRHARFASAFGPRRAALGSAEGIPGELGAEVRRRLAAGVTAGGVTAGGAPGSGVMARWARRLARELATR